MRNWKLLGVIFFLFNLNTYPVLGQITPLPSDVTVKPLAIPQVGPVQIYRGQQIEQAGETSATIFSALSDDLAIQGLKINMDNSALIKTPQGSRNGLHVGIVH